MKRLLCFALCLMMLAATLCGCADTNNPVKEPDTTEPEVTTTEATTTQEVTTTEATTTTEETTTEATTTEPEPEPLVYIEGLFDRIAVVEANQTNLEITNVEQGTGTEYAVYDEDGEGVLVNGATLIAFALPKDVPVGSTIVAHVKGSSEDNFRVWLMDANIATASNQINMQTDMQFFSYGEYEFFLELTAQYFDADIADNLAKKIIFKAPSWDTTLTNLRIDEIGIFEGTLEEYRAACENPPADTTDDTAVTTAPEGDKTPAEATTTVATTTEAVTTTEATTTAATTTEATTAKTEAEDDEPAKLSASQMAYVAEKFMDRVKTDEFCPDSYTKNKGNNGKMVHKTYYSTTCNRDKGVNIYLPKNYDDSKEYPVMYLLHGIWGDEYSMTSDTYLNIISNMIAEGIAKEMIVVFPSMYSSATQPNCTAIDEPNSKAYDNFLNDLTVDLMPWIEENYSIKTGRDNTAVIGFSMGGREALAIGLTHADKFGYVGAIAPAPGLVPGRDWAMEHYGQFKESELKYDEYTPFLTMVCCGTKDGTVGSFPKTYHEIFNRNGTNHIWYEITGSDHGDPAIPSGIYNFCKYVFQCKYTVK